MPVKKYHIRLILLVIVFICAFQKTGKAGQAYANREKHPYNFIVFLTDDQRWDTLWAMPNVQEKLVKNGVTFTNAFVSTPLCCPSRASLLAGGFYAQNTGVLENYPLNGSVTHFDDSDTLATRLQEKGYKTSLIGRYMNLYGSQQLGIYKNRYIPPGWDFISATAEKYQVRNSLTDYYLLEGSSKSSSTQGRFKGPVKQYKTYYQRDRAIDFIKNNREHPFFLLFSSDVPHRICSAPAPGDETSFSSFYYRGRSYKKGSTKDEGGRPNWISKRIMGTESDKTHRAQMQALKALDRAIGEVVEAVEESGLLDRTVFIFTSDNGELWGEHGLHGKGMPYEEAIRVPFIVCMPGIEPRTDDHLVVGNLDIGPTLYELAGISMETDGSSLIPLLKNPDHPWREEFLIEHFGKWPLQNWAGIRTKKGDKEFKFVTYATGEKELYDLSNDPLEMKNVVDASEYKKTRENFEKKLKAQQGLSLSNIVTDSIGGHIGRTYSYQLHPRGGRAPYEWNLVRGKLPNGLELNPDSGIIQGIPAEKSSGYVMFQTQAANIAKYNRKPQSYNLLIPITISPLMGSKLLSVPDINGNGSNEFALIGTDNSGGYLFLVLDYDGKTAAPLSTLYTKNDIPIAFSVLPPSFDQTSDIAILYFNRHKAKVIILDPLNNVKKRGFPLDDIVEPFFIQALSDINGNGYPELAILGKDAQKNISVQIRDSFSGHKISKIPVEKITSPVDMVISQDQNHNHTPEILIAGLSRDGNLLVQIKDTLTAEQVSQLSFEEIYAPCALRILPDIDQDGIPEVAVLGMSRSGYVPQAIMQNMTGSGERVPLEYKHSSGDIHYVPLAMELIHDPKNGGPVLAVLCQNIQPSNIRSHCMILIDLATQESTMKYYPLSEILGSNNLRFGENQIMTMVENQQLAVLLKSRNPKENHAGIYILNPFQQNDGQYIKLW